MPASAGPDRRIAVAIIRRKNGDYFVHQRLASKRQYPSLFGVGAGGSCEPGELPELAAARELEEETGLSGTLTPLYSLEYREPGTFHELFVFELTTDASPRHDASEWQWSGWLTPAELAELADAGKLCPDTAALLQRYWALERN
ncbi:MAG TPA: NUDIX hydrolase [Polyangiaceae bacterium]|nr:NUDIX hydrolase [Polyangiaceae bacterium]